ncbi:MFS transporter [Kineococcus sp. NPDC059986]|uniref:MFS transporter n=1 Tax=Kineococcus sp. NPDC059986 TaxID=3155538 RepID=UPI00344F0B7C
MSSSTTSDGSTALRKAALRLIPFVAVMFFINYLDRTAISFAGPNGMNDDLALTAAQYGFAAGIFFVGYIVLEIPSNLALHRFGARKWLARIMVSWGIVAILFTWVQSDTQLYWLRFLLGVTEAGFFPGAILFLTLWFPREYRRRALAGFYLAQPLTTVIGAPLAGFLMQSGHGVFGLEGWRFMFLCVGVPAIVLGVACWFYLTDRPEDARWLTADERAWMRRELDAEAGENEQRGHVSARRILREGRVWALAVAYFGLIYGLYSLAFFLPTIIGGFQERFGTTFSVFEKGLVTAVPYVPAAVALYLWSRHIHRHGFKSWHIALPTLLAGLSVPIALYMDSPFLTILVIAVTACGIFMALPNFWSLPAQFLTGAAAAAGIAFINTFGNIGGFSAPYVTGWLTDLTGDEKLGLWLTGGLLVVSSAILLELSRRSRAASSPDPATAQTTAA